MNPRERLWWVGAYALTATLPSFSEQDAAGFYADVRRLPSLGGLELPVHRLEKADDPWRHLHCLPRDIDYILTPLPYVMQSLALQPLFGLASPDAEGRVAALQLVEDIRIRIRRLEDHCGRAAVRAVELHSAPTGKAKDAALRQSLEEILQKDWGTVELWVEHCDAFRPGQTPAKGFLDIEAELAILRDLSLGMTINWGRSVLETRRPEGALEHLQKAREAGVLRGLFFSAVTVHDPVYGTWLDNHAPLQGVGQGSWQPQNSLLTGDQVQAALQLIHDAPYRGLKIQPAPSTLPLAERLACVRQHLEFLSGPGMP
ncbi:DUF4862 family protein [Oligoflexus tunisiensis]|uniref:DUF4862 family protein n=1 Tax=Oligoflexus tunisiensis TaxID=708132 RepID=UPI00159EFB15|nr:DUF4862 family protein [Oligoflexus tunisiensis]